MTKTLLKRPANYLSILEAAEILNSSRQGVRYWVITKDIPRTYEKALGSKRRLIFDFEKLKEALNI